MYSLSKQRLLLLKAVGFAFSFTACLYPSSCSRCNRLFFLDIDIVTFIVVFDGIRLLLHCLGGSCGGFKGAHLTGVPQKKSRLRRGRSLLTLR